MAVENLSDPACEVLWRLRADDVITKEDYEVIRDALYKLADIEESDKVLPIKWFVSKLRKGE